MSLNENNIGDLVEFHYCLDIWKLVVLIKFTPEQAYPYTVRYVAEGMMTHFQQPCYYYEVRRINDNL
jgi:hypothetical protein